MSAKILNLFERKSDGNIINKEKKHQKDLLQIK